MLSKLAQGIAMMESSLCRVSPTHAAKVKCRRAESQIDTNLMQKDISCRDTVPAVQIFKNDLAIEGSNASLLLEFR